MALALGLPAAPALGARCEPVRVALEGAAPSAAWRAAHDELVATTSAEGHLWSCAGGELLVVIAADGESATLRRRDPRGREAVRRVTAAGDLVSTAEALLALSATPVPPPPSEPPSPGAAGSAVAPGSAAAAGSAGAAGAPQEAPAAPASQEPRLIAEALLAVRYGGVLRSVWGAGTLRIAVPLEAWSVGAWVRYAIPYVLDPTPMDFSMSDVGFGLSLGRRLLRAGSLELHATFDPSIGFVSMEGGAEPRLVQGAKVDARLGIGLRAVLRLTRMWRGLVVLDGELAPASVAKARRIDPSLPPLPAYSVGVSVGVEAAFL